MSQSMEDTVNRVMALAPIDGSADPSESDALLLRQYFRNAYALSRSVAVWKGGPFFDPRNVIGRNLSPEHAEVVKSVHARLPQPNGYVKYLCVASVAWAGYVVEGERLACEHAELFEPLLRLFEKGIGFSIHHGEILIGRFALPLSAWKWVAPGNRWETPGS